MKVLERTASQGLAPRPDCLIPPGTFRPGSVPAKVPLSRSRQLLELACQVIGAPYGGVGLLGPEGDLAGHIPFGVAEEAAAKMDRSPQLAQLVEWVLEQPGPVCLDNLTASHPQLGALLELPPLGPFLGVPLLGSGRQRGVLYLARRAGEPAFQPRDVAALEPIRTWLEQGNLYEESHLLSQLRLLNRVAQAAASNLDLDLILQRALRELDRHLPLHICLVWLVEDPAEALSLAAASSIPSSRAAELGLVPGMRLTVAQTPFAGCLRDGEALYADLSEPAGAAPRGAAGPARPAPSVLTQGLLTHGVTCFFAAPLRAGDQTVGILQSVCTRPSGFTGEQIQLLYLVADLLGPAISNCRLFERLRTTYEELRATQEQLIRAEKMRALGELASGMAHDFNNSLCGVLGFLELTLTDRTLSTSSRNYLESARTCALDAAQTVRRVQEFARWRRHDPVFQELNVNDLVQQTVELTRPRWDSLSRTWGGAIAVEVRAEAAAAVSGNAAELREVLTNLVFNAVDAMPQGGTLTLSSWSTRTEVFLAVRDTGVGMSAAVRQRLFEPFFTTKGEQGNGMGLSVAFGIIESHGGEISVVSEVGRGTTFTVRLPALRPKASAERGLSSAEHEGQASLLALRSSVSAGLRILVVEDEESIRAFLETVLTQLGHRPRLVADADLGLTAFAEEAFDLVLTDLSLPGLSGEELARTIFHRSPQTPVVLLTGWADQLKAEAKSLPGVTHILGKPVTISSLTETLAAVHPLCAQAISVVLHSPLTTATTSSCVH